MIASLIYFLYIYVEMYLAICEYYTTRKYMFCLRNMSDAWVSLYVAPFKGGSQNYNWRVCMALQEHCQRSGGSLLPEHLNESFVYVGIQLQSIQGYDGLQRKICRMWNRKYCNFFLDACEILTLLIWNC